MPSPSLSNIVVCVQPSVNIRPPEVQNWRRYNGEFESRSQPMTFVMIQKLTNGTSKAVGFLV
jgi:hypothetical protein